ncbi:hypothetical protein D2195_26600 (plasmid) [Escherichia coli]|nr:hypothetical protein D2195_26600 [Escherichia coli]
MTTDYLQQCPLPNHAAQLGLHRASRAPLAETPSQVGLISLKILELNELLLTLLPAPRSLPVTDVPVLTFQLIHLCEISCCEVCPYVMPASVVRNASWWTILHCISINNFNAKIGCKRGCNEVNNILFFFDYRDMGYIVFLKNGVEHHTKTKTINEHPPGGSLYKILAGSDLHRGIGHHHIPAVGQAAISTGRDKLICITSTLGTKGEGQRLICGNFESVQFPSSGLAVFNG